MEKNCPYGVACSSGRCCGHISCAAAVLHSLVLRLCAARSSSTLLLQHVSFPHPAGNGKGQQQLVGSQEPGRGLQHHPSCPLPTWVCFLPLALWPCGCTISFCSSIPALPPPSPPDLPYPITGSAWKLLGESLCYTRRYLCPRGAG